MNKFFLVRFEILALVEDLNGYSSKDTLHKRFFGIDKRCLCDTVGNSYCFISETIETVPL